MAILAHQPVKGAYALAAVAATLGTLPWYILKFTLPRFRPHARWTFGQALRVHLLKTLVYVFSRVHFKTPLDLAPGALKDRFEYVHPGAAKLYKGPLATSRVSPGTVYGIWYPERPASTATTSTSTSSGSRPTTILHFHGGAYVIGSPRPDYSGLMGGVLASHVAPRVFMLGYRLASNPGGAFPAALQDAVSAYAQLLKQGYAASDIVVSGDSAGGNLAIAFLRYLHEHAGGEDSETGLPLPRAALLWSPWVEVSAFAEAKAAGESAPAPMDPKYEATDYLPHAFPLWGSEEYATPASLGEGGKWRAYVSSGSEKGAAYASPIPLFVHVCETEVLKSQGLDWAEGMRAAGSGRVETRIEADAPHDIILSGANVGMEDMAVAGAEAAGRFLDSVWEEKE